MGKKQQTHTFRDPQKLQADCNKLQTRGPCYQPEDLSKKQSDAADVLEFLVGSKVFASGGQVIDARLAPLSCDQDGAPEIAQSTTRFANPQSLEILARIVPALFTNGLGIPLLPRAYWTSTVPTHMEQHQSTTPYIWPMPPLTHRTIAEEPVVKKNPDLDLLLNGGYLQERFDPAGFSITGDENKSP